MNTVENLMKKILSLNGVYAAFIPTENQIDEIFEVESRAGSLSGFPLHNLSLEESMKRRHHICIFQKFDMNEVEHHLIKMVNKHGDTAGFDIPPRLRHEVEGRDDLVWVSDDFVMDPEYATGPVTLVVNPCPVYIFDKGEGVENAIQMIPAAPADNLMRDIFMVSRSPSLSSAIISFDDVPGEIEILGFSISSSAYYQTCHIHC